MPQSVNLLWQVMDANIALVVIFLDLFYRSRMPYTPLCNGSLTFGVAIILKARDLETAWLYGEGKLRMGCIPGNLMSWRRLTSIPVVGRMW
jgi:hypothetical protein